MKKGLAIINAMLEGQERRARLEVPRPVVPTHALSKDDAWALIIASERQRCEDYHAELIEWFQGERIP